MNYTRRLFTKHSSAALFGMAFFPARTSGSAVTNAWDAGTTEYPSNESAPTHNLDDPFTRELTAIALDAARSAGATYADVRLTITREHSMWNYGVDIFSKPQREHRAVGIRALVNGAWGFAAGPVWTRDEVARLGHQAVQIGKANAAVNARSGVSPITLDGHPANESGTWTTPIRQDPFLIPFSEKADVLLAYLELGNRMLERTGDPMTTVAYRRQEKVLATTDGVFQDQTLYWIEPVYAVNGMKSAIMSSLFQPTAAGWEGYADMYPQLKEELPTLFEILPEKENAIPVMPDRYDVVFDQYAMAQLVGRTIGVASEFDRALGWEANAGGTSYLAPPQDMIGKQVFGSPLVHVIADRSRPGGSATVKWDDEGVAPRQYPLVKDGVLMNYHLTREFAMEYSTIRKTGSPIRASGCAASDHAMGVTMLQSPNVELLPANDSTTFEDLVSSMAKGLVICGGSVFTDRQQLNGEVDGHLVYEIRKGKKVAVLSNSEVLFRSPELWKNLAALGGKATQRYSGLTVVKGQPEQEHRFGIGAVPALFRNVAVTDIMRKS